MSSSPERNRRADARRSRAAILDAAIRVLDARPDAGLEAVAADAGVTRQTVYAHFPSREHLLLAVLDRITEQTVAAMDAVALDGVPAADALFALLDAAIRTAGRHSELVHRAAALPVDPQDDHARHAPVADRIRAAIQRGQGSGEFDAALPLDWLVVATIELAHLASGEQHAGRMTRDQAAHALRTSLLRLLGVPLSLGRPRSSS